MQIGNDPRSFIDYPLEKISRTKTALICQDSKTSSFPRPESSFISNSTISDIEVKKTSIDSNSFQELTQILDENSKQIEQNFEKLEQIKEREEPLENVLEVEQFSTETIGFVAELIEGTKLLNEISNDQIFHNIPMHQKMEKLGSLISLGSALITTLDMGLLGLGIAYKSKILQESREIFKQLKTQYQKEVELSSTFNQIDPNVGKEDKHVFSKEELLAIKQKMKEWEIKIGIAEKNLAKEKGEFRLKLTYYPLSAIKPIVDHFSHLKILESTGPSSCITSGLLVIISGLELKKATDQAKHLHKWTEAYKKWQDKHQPKFKITEDDVKRENFHPSSLKHPIIEKEEHIKNLYHLIKQSKDIKEIRDLLKEFNIDLNPSIQSKEEFLSSLESDSECQKIFDQYVSFQNTLEALNTIILTSENLLDKRQAIAKKKILQLKPHFQTIAPKIQEIKKNSFIRDIKQICAELKDGNYNEEIEAKLKNLGFFHSEVVDQQFFKGFQDFKNANKEELQIALTNWMEDPQAIEAHFQKWFDIQDKDLLLASYIDHQETIEHTTKNALKQMVQKKHEVETRFMKLNLNKSRIAFTVAVLTLAASVTLAILGLLSIPFGGAGIILIVLSAASLSVSLGFVAARYYQSCIYKPHTVRTANLVFQIKKSWIQLKTSIHTYLHQAKEKKCLEIAKTIDLLNSKNIDQKTSKIHQKAKLNFEKSLEKVKEWSEKLKDFEERLAKAGWQDFAYQASLKNSENPNDFDTLRAFQEALKACDLSLLSEETQSLLELQLGINLKTLQIDIQKDPDAIKNALQEFFILDDANLVSFIKNQQIRIHKNLLKKI